jgi:hypothetical protein
MKKKAAAKPNRDIEAMKKAENFVRPALSVLSDKRVSDAKVRSVAKKVSRAFPAGCVT